MTTLLKVDKIYIVHVSTAIDRANHIKKMMQKFGFEYELMLEGDIKDLNEKVLNKYFDKNFVKEARPAVISCALKHLLIYEKIIADNVKSALILEDDVFLMPNFISVFNQSIEELEQTGNLKKAMINYENSTLQFAKNETKDTSKVLFPSHKSRCAAAYFMSNTLAQKIINYTIENKCNLPIDWYHNDLVSKIDIQHYWCHPTIVEQGSHNGKIASLIDEKKHGVLRQISWKIQKIYKQKIRPLFR